MPDSGQENWILSHIIEDGSITPNPKKVANVNEMER